MAKWNAARGSTGRIAWVFLPDSGSTVGAGKTALTNASAGLNISVRRELTAAVSTYTGANIGAITTLATWVNPGAGKVNFKEVDATNLPGLYELHFVDLQFATGDGSRWLGGMVTATGVAPSPFEIALDAMDAQDATAAGLTRIDAAVSSRMATYTQPTGFLAATFPGAVASPTNITAGTLTTVTGAVGSVTGNVGGNVTGTVASVVDITTTAQAELAAVPASNATPLAKLNWLFLLARNKLTQTSTTQIVKANDDSTTVGTSTVSDDGTTATRGKFA